MPDESNIERAARIADAMVAELSGMKPKARRHHYDRQSILQIDYAIRSIKRLAERIRAAKTIDAVENAPDDGNVLADAVAIIKELRPIVAQSRDTAWKQFMLKKMDDVLKR